MQLLDGSVKQTGDLDELRAIHRHLFQDVYGWPGEPREDHALRGMDRDQLIEQLAYHYDAFNYFHPFRGGNGRTQRVFWNRFAGHAGWQLDWRTVAGRPGTWLRNFGSRDPARVLRRPQSEHSQEHGVRELWVRGNLLLQS